MATITNKQRRNAEREITSAACAGCDGPKNRGPMFCRKCERILFDDGFSSPAGYAYVAEAYTERLEFLLSRKGQRLRRSLESVNAVATHSPV